MSENSLLPSIDLLEQMKVKSGEIMEVEKKHSKSGFFHLFDWNGKSRKKLFLNNAEISGESKNGKHVVNLLKSPSYTTEGDEYNAGSSNGRSADFSSASSVVSDEGYGSKAPGVVARLMGLDSLPRPNVSEPSFTTYSGSCSLRASHLERSTPNLWNEYQSTDYTDISNKLDRSSSNTIDPRFHKVQNRPIERFQTEILPPKSAKPIPITHHKLLSPIKNPGFIPTKNAAYIMETAAKIIEVSPQTTSKHRVPSFGSSVPLKIRDLKDKIEAGHKVSRPQRPDGPSTSTGKSLKGQHKDRSPNKSDYTPTFRISRDSNGSRNKGKSVPLAEQARVNVRRKEGSFASGNGSSANPKEGADAKRKQFSKSQADIRKPAENGTSTNRTNNALRQNNQKQNCISNRDYSISKISTSDQQGRKARSSASQSRKTGSLASDPSKELPLSRRKNLPRKKQPVNRYLLSGETVPETSSMKSTEKRSIKCNVTTDGNSNRDAEKMKTSMDVISFTFTSPIKRSMLDLPSGDNDSLFPKSSGLSSPGLNIIGGDALSVILGKQLQDLTYRVESSNCNIILEENSSIPSSSTLTTTSMRHHERPQPDPDKDISYSLADFDCSSIDIPELDWRRMQQISDEIEDLNASNRSNETSIEVDHQHPTPLSTLELVVTGNLKESTNWELDYVKTMLKDSEVKFTEYALGQTDNIITPNASTRHGEDHDKLEQKLLFDCVSESLKLRCERVFDGRCKGMMKNKGWLAEEIYKEILSWKNNGELMVEELVEKDMNTKHGRWLDFDMEAFEEGLEIEKALLTCLLDDLVFDLLL